MILRLLYILQSFLQIFVTLLDGVADKLRLLLTTQRDAQAVLQTLVAHELDLVILQLQGFHQRLLDGDGLLDQDEVGHRLVALEAGQVASYLLIQLASPFHIVGHVAIVLVAVQGGQRHSL